MHESAKHRDEFLEFHRNNPHVYKTLAAMALRYRQRHPSMKIGIATLWENLRWDFMMSTDHHQYKLNNNHKSFYARLLMEREPELNGLFELRAQKVAA